MLYQFHEWQSTALAPLRLFFSAGHQYLSHPLSRIAFGSFGDAMLVAHDALERTGLRDRRLPFDVSTAVVNGVDGPVVETPARQKPFCTLLRFECDRKVSGARVLVVAPMSGHFATELREFVAGLLSDHDVWLTDWQDAREISASEGSFGLDDYIAYMKEFIQFLGPDLHVAAICQGTVPALAAVSLLAEDDDAATPRSLTLLGGPIDTRINPTEIDNLATSHPLSWFENTQIAVVPHHYRGAGRRVHPGFVQLATFMTANLDRMVNLRATVAELRLMGDADGTAAAERSYAEFFAVMDLTADFYLETVRAIFQDHAFPRGEMIWSGQRIRPSAIRNTALMTVEGGCDEVSGRGQTHAAHEICPSIPARKRRRHFVREADHMDLFCGAVWSKRILPSVRDFIRAH